MIPWIPTIAGLEVTQNEEVNIIRKKQNTIRYDCNGHVTSTGLETVNVLSHRITIDYPNRKKAWSYEVYNRLTKSSNAGVFLEPGQFVVDFSPTVFNMRVYEGFNDVEYVFKKCTIPGTDENGFKACKGEILTEKEGIIRIDVHYRVEILPGDQEIRPTPDQCQHPSSSAPDRSSESVE